MEIITEENPDVEEFAANFYGPGVIIFPNSLPGLEG